MKYICEQCDQKFKAPPSQNARFCNRDCYDDFRKGIYECDNCKRIFERFKCRTKKYKRNLCSRKCHRKFIEKSVKNQPAFKNGVASYRKIIEEHFNKKLKPNEIIHHVDGNRINNDIENLKITTRSEHPNLHPEVGFQKGHKQLNTGRTWFKSKR